MTAELMEAFQSIAVFLGISSEALDRLAAMSFLQDLPADVVLAEQCEVPDFL